jgi:dTDP-4-dehydrorhamnose 3,5-epimerase
MTMRFEETGIAGAMVIEPAPHADSRGRFMRSWCVREFADSGIEFVPVQANRGFSTKRGTLRGMHFQAEPARSDLRRRSRSAAGVDVVPQVARRRAERR